MPLKELLTLSAQPRARYGPSPVFAPSDVVRALYEIGAREPIGRADLTKQLGIGEGSLRTILARLNSKGWLDTNRSGAKLSKTGRRLCDELQTAFPLVVVLPKLDACFSKTSAGILVTGKAAKAGSALALRDTAIRAGAGGATILARVKGVWRFPNDNARVRKADEASLDEAVVNAQDGDALVLSFGDLPALEWRGAWSAALELV